MGLKWKYFLEFIKNKNKNERIILTTYKILKNDIITCNFFKTKPERRIKQFMIIPNLKNAKTNKIYDHNFSLSTEPIFTFKFTESFSPASSTPNSKDSDFF